jgi:ATP-dependent Lhr-like helicase
MDLKIRLPRTWPVFFSRFGRLLPIQEAAIPPILDGRNVLLSSPTATGKTEAVVAPICERLRPGGPLQALYVAPTRALVNDLDARLADPMRELEIDWAVRTGDRPSFRRGRAAQFVVTTPESLDSILSRMADSLAALRFLVIDEIHLLDGTCRGDQMRVLARRLPKGVQFAALSATSSTPKRTAARYFSGARIVEAPGAREIDLRPVDDAELPSLRERFLERGIRKAIFFCNTRRETEALAARLRAFLPKVHAHHGSLSRQEREEVESAMRDQRIGFVAATMTLEFGIDIGDVDAIVLYGAPDSVSSLLQRLGRGNRRTGRCVGYAVHRGEAERRAMARLLSAAARGRVERKRYAPHPSVAVQQIFSMVFRGAVDRAALQALCSPAEIDAILAHLVRQDYLTPAHRMGERLAAMAERGLIHSNIADSEPWQVVDVRTLQPIGDAPAGEGPIALGGRGWTVVRREPSERRIYVKPGPAAESAGFSPRSGRGRFWGLLPKALRERESGLSEI